MFVAMQKLISLLAAVSVLTVAVVAVGQSKGPAKVDFTKQIKPILVKSCVGCHSSARPAGGLALDNNDGIKKGGESGALFTAGKGKDSLLVKYLDGRKKPQMPKKAAPLTADQIKMVTQWIDEGGKF